MAIYVCNIKLVEAPGCRRLSLNVFANTSVKRRRFWAVVMAVRRSSKAPLLRGQLTTMSKSSLMRRFARRSMLISLNFSMSAQETLILVSSMLRTCTASFAYLFSIHSHRVVTQWDGDEWCAYDTEELAIALCVIVRENSGRYFVPTQVIRNEMDRS